MKRILVMVSVSGIFAFQGFAQEQASRLSAKLKVSNARDIAYTRNISQSFDQEIGNQGRRKTLRGLPSLSKSDFDFVDLYQAALKDGSTTAIVAPYKGKNRPEKIAFVVFKNKGTYVRPMLIKAAADRSQLVYYDLENGIELTITKQGNSVTFSHSSIGSDEIAARHSGCGQAVIDCVADIYTNRGWGSVWASFQSIFLPATGAAIVAACVGERCL